MRMVMSHAGERALKKTPTMLPARGGLNMRRAKGAGAGTLTKRGAETTAGRRAKGGGGVREGEGERAVSRRGGARPRALTDEEDRLHEHHRLVVHQRPAREGGQEEEVTAGGRRRAGQSGQGRAALRLRPLAGAALRGTRIRVESGWGGG